MWKRKELKRGAKHSLKKNYWNLIAVCFLLAILAGMFAGSTTLIDNYNSDNETTEAVANETVNQGSSDIIQENLEYYAATHPDSATWQIVVIDAAGVLVNGFVSNKGTAITILKIVDNFVYKNGDWVAAILLAGMLIRLLYWLFVKNILQVGGNRMFLESHTYSGTRINRLFYLYRMRNIKHPAAIMCRMAIYQWLWSLTIIGGIIKYYEYKMIPFIVAENPNVDRKTAFRMSKELMRGNKWRTFVLGLSFIGWSFLSAATFGLLNIFFVNAYTQGTYAELYVALRAGALAKTPEYGETFNDGALFAMPESAAAEERPIYDIALCPAQPIERVERNIPNADRRYTVTSLILMFFAFSFVGWMYEVSIHLVTDGVFVNRGTMFGPWLPIYGSGGVLIVILLRRFMKNPPLTFGLAVAICGTVEYLTSWYLEMTKGIKWWDYSGYFMNINGRVCLEGLVVFGIGGCAFLYFIAPKMDDLIQKIPKKIQIEMCIVLCALFGADTVYSHFNPNTGAGITDYD